MAIIDFYLLTESSASNSLVLACKIGEKSWLQGLSTYISCQNDEQINRLDSLLWTFRQESFVPHQRLNVNSHSENDRTIDAETKEVVWYGGESTPDMETIINLGNTPITKQPMIKRIAEIVEHNDNAKQSGRERYKYYRNNGYELRTHQIN